MAGCRYEGCSESNRQSSFRMHMWRCRPSGRLTLPARGGFFFREAVSSPRLPPAWQRRIRPPEDRLLDDVLFAR